MVKRWQLYEEKNKISKLVDKAIAQGPQVVTRGGRGRDGPLQERLRAFEKIPDQPCGHFPELTPSGGELIWIATSHTPEMFNHELHLER